ncbi:MAG: hypothetical protein IJT62_09310 [Oscillospiraceae bacterium]|nr:hypothetical protein [Oscillospiraceae bacterium]
MGKHEKKKNPSPRSGYTETNDTEDIFAAWDEDILRDADELDDILSFEVSNVPLTPAQPEFPPLANVVPVKELNVPSMTGWADAPAEEPAGEDPFALFTADSAPEEAAKEPEAFDFFSEKLSRPESAPAPERPAPEEKPESEKMPAPERRPQGERKSSDRKPSRPSDHRPRPDGEQPRKKSPQGKKRGRGKKRRRRKDRFKKGLRIYLIILLVIIIGVLAALWVILDKYQKQKDREDAAFSETLAAQAAERQHEKDVHRAPQRAFEAWRDQLTADYWIGLWNQSHPDGLDGAERTAQVISEKYAPEALESFKALEFTQENPVYVLKNGDETMARITLSGSDVNWTVSQVEMLLQGKESASVRVASGSRIYCNGIELNRDYMVDSTSYFTYEPLRDKLENPVSWDTYKVDGLLLPPELTVDPPVGRTITETANGDFLLCLPDDQALAYREKSVAFVRAYLFYYMSGGNGTWGNMYNALAYLTPGTQAYQDLRATYDGVYWNTAYANIDTSKTTSGGVVIWADNCYSVDVTYDADCTINGQHVDYADATMRIYFLKTDNGFIISNFETL